MDEVSLNVHPYSDHLLLEVIVDAGDGNVSVRSVTLDVVDGDGGHVTPRGSLPTTYEDEIRTRLADAGYALEAERVA